MPPFLLSESPFFSKWRFSRTELILMPNFQALPGFREFYPEDYAERRHVFQIWRQVARRFGFQEFDGPVLESLELFKAKSGEEIEEQLFSFQDKGGREVSLRPEYTPTLARMVAAKANALKRPVKWFCMGDNFRYERMQRGRLRCFSQFNADILGEGGPAADVEMISLLIQILLSFGLTDEDFYVRLSDRDLWTIYLAVLGYKDDSAAKILSVIDKWDKAPEDKIRAMLSDIDGAKAAELWDAIATFVKLDSLEGISSVFSCLDIPDTTALQLQERLKAWEDLLNGLNAMGFGEFIKIDFGIVRGLAYYTGFVFEAFDRKEEEPRAIAGGGRYNTLIRKMGGPDMPAVGFGMGDVVLSDLLKSRDCMPRFLDTVDLFLVIGGPDERKAALADAALLRQAGYSVDYPFRDQGFGKQFKLASSAGARMALIYGSDELAKGIVKIRDMNDRSETDVPRDSLLEALREKLEG